MKVRIKFAKEGIMRFIGHLDMMRYFQKAFRRSGIDIQYSQGFSPHQLISFAAPLGVGLTSTGEYMDIVMGNCPSSEEMIRLLNEQMVDDVRILSVVVLPDNSKNAMSIVTTADYKINFREGMEPDFDLKKAIEDFMTQETIMVTKKTKKSEKTMDIKPMIHTFYEEDGGCFMNVDTGSTQNLKPEQVMTTLYKFMGRDFDPFSIFIHRCETYGENFKPLEKYGDIIL
ncbi:MAG: TIGR03936 family radical SAM-associated protein [Frisingicoccus sp.]|nr:TIGR03936 family radical SAM-associated protein [Frisingicoccus sp.]